MFYVTRGSRTAAAETFLARRIPWNVRLLVKGERGDGMCVWGRGGGGERRFVLYRATSSTTKRHSNIIVTRHWISVPELSPSERRKGYVPSRSPPLQAFDVTTAAVFQVNSNIEPIPPGDGTSAPPPEWEQPLRHTCPRMFQECYYERWHGEVAPSCRSRAGVT